MPQLVASLNYKIFQLPYNSSIYYIAVGFLVNLMHFHSSGVDGDVK